MESLATSYDGWPELLKDMNKTELVRALTVLDADDLRVVALCAFDGREVDLSDISQTPKGIIEKLCHAAPKSLEQKTWRNVYAKLLRDNGWKSDRVPKGLKDKVKLQRILKNSRRRIVTSFEAMSSDG